MVQLNFDANQVAPNTGYEPVPEGWYNVAITESEIKPTRDKEGAYLQLKAQVIDGPQTGKPIYIRLNIQNKNQQAVDIAYGELSAICHVTGVYQIGDSSQLHGIPFQLRVIVTKGQNGDPGNEVKGYKDARGNEPGKAGAGGGQPGNFGGAPSGQGQAQGGGFGGQPQGQGNPNAGQGGQAWGQGQGGQGQGQQPPQGQGWGGQSQGNPQGQQPPQNGPQGGGWGQGQGQGQGQQPGQGQPDPNAGQQNPQGQGGAPWGAQGNGQ